MRNQIPLSTEAIQLFIDKLHTREEKVSATIIVESNVTGKDFTYKIIGKEKNFTGTMYRHLSIYLEDGYNSFTYVYSFLGDKHIKVNLERYNNMNNRAYAGAVWLLNKLHDKDIITIMLGVKIYHTGKCIKCNRTLTDLESITFGMGKICRGIIDSPRTFNRED